MNQNPKKIPIGYKPVPVTSLLGEGVKKMEPERRNAVLDAVLFYASQVKKGLDEGATIREALEAVWEFIRIRQEEHEQWLLENKNDLRISCKPGCSNCCRMNVDVTSAEVSVILDYLREKEIDLDTDYLKKQLAGGEDYHLNPNPRCTFLGSDNLCTVYEVRPVACRKYRVFSDPDLCNLQKHGTSKVATEFLLDNESLASAMMNLGLKYGSLPEMLLAEHQKI